MTTIFTDDFCFTDLDISIGDPSMGYKGRDLIFTSEDREIRVRLLDEQLQALADVLFMEATVIAEGILE